MDKPEERVAEERATARKRAKRIDNVQDAVRLALQSAPLLGTAMDGRPIMGGMTVDEIRLKIDDMGLSYPEQDVARTVEELLSRGEVNLVHTENSVASYQWWPPANEEVA